MTRALTHGTGDDATSRMILDVVGSSPVSWRGPLGPEQLGLAHHHGLSGLMATHPNQRLREPFLGSFARAAGRQTLMVSHLQRFLEKLREASVPATVVKGPDLSSRMYRNPRYRTFTDVDVLVPEEHLPSALDVFASDEFVSSIPTKRPKADKRDIPVGDPSGRYFMVDLHWDLFSYSQLRGVAEGATEWAWKNSLFESESPLGPAYRLPDEAYLTFLCTHALLDHRFRLILFRDLAEVAAQGVDWEGLTRFAARWRLRTFTYLALAMAKEFVRAEIPEAFLSELRPKSLTLSATESLMSRTDLVRFDGHRPHPLNLAMVLLHDQRSQRLQLLAHAPPAVPTWMKRFGRPKRRRTVTKLRKSGDAARVMIVVSSDQRRGAEVFGENLAAGLRGTGWDADLVALAGTGSEARIAADRVLRPETSRGFGRLDLATVRDLRRHIRKSKPHVVLANGGSTLRYAYAALFGRKTPTRLVYSSIGEPEYWIRGPLHKWIQRKLHQRADLILAVSEATRRQLIEYVGLPEPRVRVAHTGVPDVMAVSEPLDQKDTENVLFLGNLSTEKAPSVALDVLERVGPANGMRLRFVGTGPLEQQLRSSAAARFGPGTVEFTGSVEDVGPHLAWADVLLLPSITEGLPGAVLEAGAAGVPSVAFNVGGTGEAIVAGQTGVLVAPGDVGGLAEELSRLLVEDDRRRALGTAAYELVVDRYLLRHTIDRYIECFDSVITPMDG